MKRILFVIDTLRMGGAEKALVSLLKALDPERCAVDLFVFEGGGVLQPEVPDWVHVIEGDPVTRGMTLEWRRYGKDLIAAKKFGAVAARLWLTVSSKIGHRGRFGWDIIKRHVPAVPGYYDVAVGFLEGMPDYFVIDKVFADKKVGWIHIDMSDRCPSSYEICYYDAFDKIATISDVCRNVFVGLFPNTSDRVEVIDNIVLPQEVRMKAGAYSVDGWESGVEHIVSVGRLDYQKGIDVAARTSKILKEAGLDFCWHVYGQGSMQEEIASYIQQNGLQDVFVLEGLAQNPYPYMAAADLIVQPSRWEGKSLVLDEAKILGKPIVVTNYTSVGDQIVDGKTGIITGFEPEEIAFGVQRVLGDDALREDLSANCLAEANQSIEAVKKFYELIGV